MPSASSTSSTRRRIACPVDAEVLQHERDVVLDVVDHELGLGVLVHEADDVGEVAGLASRVERPPTSTSPGNRPPRGVRHEPVGGAQQRALARARRRRRPAGPRPAPPRGRRRRARAGRRASRTRRRVVASMRPAPAHRRRARRSSGSGQRSIPGAPGRVGGATGDAEHGASERTRGRGRPSGSNVGQRSGLACQTSVSSPAAETTDERDGASRTHATISQSARAIRPVPVAAAVARAAGREHAGGDEEPIPTTPSATAAVLGATDRARRTRPRARGARRARTTRRTGRRACWPSNPNPARPWTRTATTARSSPRSSTGTMTAQDATAPHRPPAGARAVGFADRAAPTRSSTARTPARPS